MNEGSIYLDHAATTPVDDRVLQAMMKYFSDEYGNPSSVHRYGQRADAAVENSRKQMAVVLGCSPQEILFTSCGSESDNLALRGTALAERRDRQANHILISPIEHDAVLETAIDLQDHHGFELEMLPVDSNGVIDPQSVQKAVRRETAIVSIMYANNEIGSINPISEIAGYCRQYGVKLHTDAVQAASQLPIKVDELGVDLLSLGAHKFYGPKGIGALYRREGTPIHPTQTGGGQEFGLRAGTHNVPFIVGMTHALEITERERADHNKKYSQLRDQLLERIPQEIDGAKITGDRYKRLPNHASFVFEGIDGNALLAALDLAGFACSSGSACKTGDPEPSSVLLAIGLPPQLALGSLRVTVGRQTTQDHIDALLTTLPSIIERLRSRTPVAS